MRNRKEKNMEYNEIKKLMDDMGNSKLTELEIEFPDGIKISMKKDDGKKLPSPAPAVVPRGATTDEYHSGTSTSGSKK